MSNLPALGTVPFGVMLRRDWKNPPNLVTAIRMVGTLGLPPLIMSSVRKKKLAGVVLFATLAGTDKLDGWMAKQLYGSTELGKMLDPLVDKELIIVTLASLLADAKRRKDYVMMSVLLVATSVLLVREVAVARLKLEAQRRDQKVESAIQSGRVSMVLQSVATGALLVPTTSPTARKGKFVLLAAAVGASMYSWREYYLRYHLHHS